MNKHLFLVGWLTVLVSIPVAIAAVGFWIWGPKLRIIVAVTIVTKLTVATWEAYQNQNPEY